METFATIIYLPIKKFLREIQEIKNIIEHRTVFLIKLKT